MSENLQPPPGEFFGEDHPLAQGFERVKNGNGGAHEETTPSTGEPMRVHSKAPREHRASDIELRAFTPDEVMRPIQPEKFLLPGILAEAYTLIAGALASYKTTLLLYLIVWKATGWDILGLDERRDSNGIDMGRCVLVTYEDTDKRILAKLQRVIQHGYAHICQLHSQREGFEFVERAAANIRRIPLMGRADCGLVCRSAAGVIVPNEMFLDRFLEKVRAFAPRGVTMGLDPLRLAISGSQNDDDGADVAVHAMNYVATAIPESGLIVCSHMTKAGAHEPGEGYASAAYATSGSALYSQHARSNFRMARLKDTEIRELFDPAQVTPHEAQKQLVVRLAHGRLSHGGSEQSDVYLIMRANGILERIAPKGEKSAPQIMLAALAPVAEAIDRLNAADMLVTGAALENDGELRTALAGRNAVRDARTLLEQNGYLKATGKSRDRNFALTDKARATILAKANGEDQAKTPPKSPDASPP